MPPPFAVALLPHDPEWAKLAQAEAARIRQAAGIAGLQIHHIGSTAIPGFAALDDEEPAFITLGYGWHGEYGLAGRRYATLSDTGPTCGACSSMPMPTARARGFGGSRRRR